MKTIKISAVHFEMLKGIMKRKGIRKEDECIEEIIQEHIKKNKETILSKLDHLCKKNPKEKKISLDIYNIYINLDYQWVRSRIKLKI